jgi:hypothetical protein
MKVEVKIEKLRNAIHLLNQGLPLANFETRYILTKEDFIALEMECLWNHTRLMKNGNKIWSNQFFIPSEDKNQLAIQILTEKLESLEGKVLESFMC